MTASWVPSGVTTVSQRQTEACRHSSARHRTSSVSHEFLFMKEFVLMSRTRGTLPGAPLPWRRAVQRPVSLCDAGVSAGWMGHPSRGCRKGLSLPRVPQEGPSHTAQNELSGYRCHAPRPSGIGAEAPGPGLGGSTQTLRGPPHVAPPQHLSAPRVGANQHCPTWPPGLCPPRGKDQKDPQDLCRLPSGEATPPGPDGATCQLLVPGSHLQPEPRTNPPQTQCWNLGNH